MDVRLTAATFGRTGWAGKVFVPAAGDVGRTGLAYAAADKSATVTL